jgi:protein-S-isoprenylcysteine O-methyltransferase Ste14
MSEVSNDHPDVVVFPPLVPLGVLALGVGLQWLVPLDVLDRADVTPRALAGVVIAAAGLFVMANGRRALMRLGTNVNPLRPALALATGGVYRYTRNPMYVGGMTVLGGIALIVALDWLVLLMIPAAFVLHLGIVSREEQYLEHKFGEEYRRYKARSPRYVPFIG